MLSDGISGLVGEQELGAVVFRSEDLERVVQQLVALALQRGGPDNISVILVAVD